MLRSGREIAIMITGFLLGVVLMAAAWPMQHECVYCHEKFSRRQPLVAFLLDRYLIGPRCHGKCFREAHPPP